MLIFSASSILADEQAKIEKSLPDWDTVDISSLDKPQPIRIGRRFLGNGFAGHVIFKNPSDQPIKLVELTPECRCTAVTEFAGILERKSEKSIRFRIRPTRAGPFSVVATAVVDNRFLKLEFVGAIVQSVESKSPKVTFSRDGVGVISLHVADNRMKPEDVDFQFPDPGVRCVRRFNGPESIELHLQRADDAKLMTELRIAPMFAGQPLPLMTLHTEHLDVIRVVPPTVVLSRKAESANLFLQGDLRHFVGDEPIDWTLSLKSPGSPDLTRPCSTTWKKLDEHMLLLRSENVFADVEAGNYQVEASSPKQNFSFVLRLRN